MTFHSLKNLVKEHSAVLVENQTTDVEINNSLTNMDSLYGITEYCLVKNWLIVNLDIPDQEVAHFQRHGVEPMFIYATTILEDSKQRGFEWIRTTLIKHKHSDFVFSTRKTNYILVGQGYSCLMTTEHAYRQFGF